MTNLSARTKRLLAVVVVVIVVLVVGLLLLTPGGDALFGTAIIQISPQNPTLTVGQVQEMSINSIWGCEWSTKNFNIVGIVLFSGNLGAGGMREKSIKVQAVAPGQVVILADCFWVGDRTTTVTVR